MSANRIPYSQPSLLPAPPSTPSPVTPYQEPIAYAPHAVHDSKSDSDIQFVGSQPSSLSNISVSRSSTRRKKRDHGPSRRAARAFAQEETPSKGPRKKYVEAVGRNEVKAKQESKAGKGKEKERADARKKKEPGAQTNFS